MKPSLKSGGLGFLAGILNGLFGAGGGLLVVPMLEAQDLPPQRAHATSIAVILPLSLLSAALALLQGRSLDPQALWTLLPFGLAGAAAGAFLLTRMNPLLLKRMFGLVMLFAALRILLR